MVPDLTKYVWLACWYVLYVCITRRNLHDAHEEALTKRCDMLHEYIYNYMAARFLLRFIYHRRAGSPTG